jgi:SAM-dependent methyltransferase
MKSGSAEKGAADRTVAWYDRHAASFTADTERADVAELRTRFLRYLPDGGRILDVGCGVGRDALAFCQAGYSTVAFDASERMVELARDRLPASCPVLRMRFDEMAWRAEFDGVWACASLLHVPAAELPDVARRIVEALRPGGVWYASFKQGTGERRSGGRMFLNHTEESLAAAMAELPVDILETWTTIDVRSGRAGEFWTNGLVRRT